MQERHTFHLSQLQSGINISRATYAPLNVRKIARFLKEHYGIFREVAGNTKNALIQLPHFCAKSDFL